MVDPFNCIYPEEWLQPNGTGPNAGFDRGLVVTSAKYDGTRSSFAELTSRVSVAAFGSATNSIGGQQGILSSWPANSVDDDSQGGRTSLNGDNRFSYLVGTSMATPQVAGVAALIRAVKPNLANTRVVHLIKATASHCGSYGDGIGWGVIRADQAVAAALDRDVEPPSSRVKKAKLKRGVVDLKIKREDTSGSTSCVKLPTAGVKKVLVFASVERRRLPPDRQDEQGEAELPRQARPALPLLLHRDRQRGEPRSAPSRRGREGEVIA